MKFEKIIIKILRESDMLDFSTLKGGPGALSGGGWPIEKIGPGVD